MTPAARSKQREMSRLTDEELVLRALSWVGWVLHDSEQFTSLNEIKKDARWAKSYLEEYVRRSPQPPLWK